MTKELDKERKERLLPVGQPIYLQGDSKSRKVKTIYYPDEDTQDFFSKSHGKCFTQDEMEGVISKSEEIYFSNGKYGLVVSHFYTEFAPKATENDEKEAKPIYLGFCYLIVDDQLVMVPATTCNKIK